ncbi:bifunctional ADP-dependent NAD(P)H-hydrate dehydratase/NAD(P)H-hydrate epimerase [Pseudomonas nitroreducens]|uniref:bifunctional ADP-dependent NAD(P)H-hydrate dehydratase/NAD(P)H-hydrate epimerase n=1 Tax=Pseudomonas TaxID=286 RepID=UPI0007EE5DE6|nr:MULTISPECIES: bifunctional ADP-dependent NAD(P)H-hydrate dehydratase/NAD(P)H-hydrate epimerase [Pseudomonas]MDH1072259.1 bifunctional ADP-dependent NAD(P)H-hydrate dehydratase/NAD(P)H-hydrate epimerase [Pseudomonas nitroreducens]NMZ71840.1 bifunctional ADP-dependent NAD(P)H-hydrate dehydratase/NAD(P)H-hydrate epimerase [Pseudomonas nitroreducens]OBY57971.1 bifunctional ADP-dependent (S)-NAD(P)H-hydrate dehydratase/NAD(P)H-hydrate epimerase [Pseudomonas sp. AU12215]UCL86510.1 bifunctional ADP
MTAHDDLPLNLYSAQQVRDLDARLIAAGTPGFELMRRAAHAAWRALRRQWPDAGEVTVLAGHGNNAGDGYLIAALALRAGWRVRVLAVGDASRLSGDAASAHGEARAVGVDVQAWSDRAELRGVLVDALLGTGLGGEVREPYASAIAAINASGLPVLAVDIPSGLSADTGQVLGCAVNADLTVTFIGLKLGLFTAQGPDQCGELVFDGLDADPALLPESSLARRLAAASLPCLAARPKAAHKGLFGHALVIGGDTGMGGAVLLAAESALRCGAGLVSLATRAVHVPAALARRPELMARGVSSSAELLRLAERADVLVVGPGVGRDAWGRVLVSAAASLERRQVWDADALNLLAEERVARPSGDWVITPHPAEAARLLGISTAEVQADRPKAALALAQRYQAVAVLKGVGSLIASPDGRLALCDHGHPAMAGAGLGDVLSGILGALLAQGLPAFDAACLAVWLHARAGESLGAQGRGLAAADLIPAVRQLLEELCPCLN